MAQKVVPSETTTTTKFRPPAKSSGFTLTSTEALLGAAAAAAYLLFGLRQPASTPAPASGSGSTPSAGSGGTSALPPETVAATPPQAPTLLEQIGRTADSVVVECNPVSGALQYTWYDEQTNLPLASSPTNVARISNLQANTTYLVYVVASNAAGSSAPSQPLLVGTNLTNVPVVSSPSPALPKVTTTVIVELLTGQAPQGAGGTTTGTPPKTTSGKPTLLGKTEHYLFFDAATCLYHFEVIGQYSDGTTRDLGTVTRKKSGCTPQAAKKAPPQVTLRYTYNHYLSFNDQTCLDTFQKMGVYSDGTTRPIGQPFTQKHPGCTPATPSTVTVGGKTYAVQPNNVGGESLNLGHSGGTLHQGTPPAQAPYNLTHTSPLGTSAGAVRVQLGWAPIAGATHYVVSLASGRVLTQVPSNAVTNGMVLANVYLQPNLPYRLAVQACNAYGCGPKSYFDNGQAMTFEPYPGTQHTTSGGQGTPAAGLSQQQLSQTPPDTGGGNLGQAQSVVKTSSTSASSSSRQAPHTLYTYDHFLYFDAASCMERFQRIAVLSNGTHQVLGEVEKPKAGCTPSTVTVGGRTYAVQSNNAGGYTLNLGHSSTAAAPSTTTHTATKATAPRLVSSYTHFWYFDAATCLYHFQKVGVYSDGTHRVLSTYTQLKAGCHPK